MTSTGGVTAGGTGGTTIVPNSCGNGTRDPGEQCDCGTEPKKLPDGCKATNGIFYGDGTGCTKTCTPEPSCLDGTGKTQACTTSCGDGNVDPGEACDDGNLQGGDGCSSACEVEDGFTCVAQTVLDAAPCASGSGQCLPLSMIYRDFQPENVAVGGHPDFPFLGTKYNGSKPTTICVPNSGGPAKGNDSTARCWGIVADSLLGGRPQPGPTTTCACQFSDWNIGNSSRIPGNYTWAGNDSPLSDGSGSIQGGNAGSTVNTTSTGGAYTGTITGYTASSPGGPIWKGTVPTYKDAASFNQWFNDDLSVNKTFTAALELSSIGSNMYQYASKSHLMQGGFYPLDALNPSQATLCNLWPYWNHGNGQPIWAGCSGDQYLFPPRVTSADCASGDTVDDGCWVTSVYGVKHDNYFTDEARYYFVYDGTIGISISFYGDDDLFVFINGVLVLDLGGIHSQLPGKVTVLGDPGDAKVMEGGCLDSAGNQTGTSAGSTACSPVNAKASGAGPDDFRNRAVKLGLQTGKVYELAIFGADRHPPESNFQLTVQGFTRKRSSCQSN
jgi:cysteine-rich repeat protein